MNKGELIAAVAGEAAINKTEAEKALNSITGNITKSLKKGNGVALVGFGSFSVKKRAARSLSGLSLSNKEISLPIMSVLFGQSYFLN